MRLMAQMVIVAAELLVLGSASAAEDELEPLSARIDSLQQVKIDLESDLASLTALIDSLIALRTDMRTIQDTTAGILATLRMDAKFRPEPSAFSEVLATLPKGTRVVAIAFWNGFFKVRFGNDIGYLNSMYFPQDERLENLVRLARDEEAALARQHTSTTQALEEAALARQHTSTTHVLDVLAVAGKTPSEVRKILGAPTGNETAGSRGKTYPKKLYKDGKVEIVFVNGKADWITVDGLENLPFGSETLRSLGLEPTVPTFSNQFTIRWENLQGLREVSLFPDDSRGVDYAYVLVRTKP